MIAVRSARGYDYGEMAERHGYNHCLFTSSALRTCWILKDVTAIIIIVLHITRDEDYARTGGDVSSIIIVWSRPRRSTLRQCWTLKDVSAIIVVLLIAVDDNYGKY